MHFVAAQLQAWERWYQLAYQRPPVKEYRTALFRNQPKQLPCMRKRLRVVSELILKLILWLIQLRIPI